MEFQMKIRFVRNVDGWRRGDETTVTRTAYVDRLIDNGIVEVITDYRPDPPARNASREDWAGFLTAMGHRVHPSATRTMLFDQWDGVECRG